MSFQLTIAEGKEAGKEFVFDQANVVIGRTSDCDVILYDPGVSRKHARIFADGETYFVEDMGSSNGTKVNGSVIKKQKLADGDAVALGPVVFSFSSTELAEAPQASGVASQSTRIVAAGTLKRQKGKGAAMAPEGAGAEQLRGLERASTMSMQAVSRPRVPSSSSVPARRPPSAEAAPVQRARSSTGGGGLSAAERARIKRESGGMLANFRIFWAEASGAVRGVFYGLGLAAVVGLTAGVYYLVLEGDDRKAPDHVEPVMVERQPITDSFGLGPDVDWNRPDMKVFSFRFNSPVRAVVIVHFQAKDVSQGEVVVTVNGVDVGLVPADTLGASERSHELIVPPNVLKKGEMNQVIFDNTKNPPGSDPWKIWNVWIETALLPEMPPDQLRTEAQKAFDRATKAFDAKDIGAENRYSAWEEFRKAWLMLEAHPDPKPDLYVLARDRMKEAQGELDRTCAKLLLEVQTMLSHKDWAGARATLDHVANYFPNNDQPCKFRAEQIRDQNNL